MASFLAGGGFTEQDWHGERYIQPPGGWCAQNTRLQRVTYHWVKTNQIILEHLKQTGRPFCGLLTGDLGKDFHTNKYPADRRVDFTRDEAAYVMDLTAATWVEASDFVLQHHAYDTDWFHEACRERV